jgi:hypothetical protein
MTHSFISTLDSFKIAYFVKHHQKFIPFENEQVAIILQSVGRQRQKHNLLNVVMFLRVVAQGWHMALTTWMATGCCFSVLFFLIKKVPKKSSRQESHRTGASAPPAYFAARVRCGFDMLLFECGSTLPRCYALGQGLFGEAPEHNVNYKRMPKEKAGQSGCNCLRHLIIISIMLNSLGLDFLGRSFWCVSDAALWILQRAGSCSGALATLEMMAARGKRQCTAAGRAKNVTQKNNGSEGGGGITKKCIFATVF